MLVSENRRNVKSVKPHHIAFASFYGESLNSLDAFIISHKHILKVEASNLLKHDDIWELIIKELRKVEKPFQKTIIEYYDKVKLHTGKSPFKLLQKNKNGYESHKNCDCLEVMRNLAFCFDFFNVLQRPYYIEIIKSSINKELEYLNWMSQKNQNWTRDFNRLKSELLKYNIHFDQIINKED